MTTVYLLRRGCVKNKTSHVEACSHGTLLGLASAAPVAPVAGLPPGTGGAPLLQGNLLSWGGILQPGAQGLHMLIGFANVILLPVFDKTVPGAKEGKRHLILSALVIELFHPFIVQGPGSFVVFPVCDHVFQLSGGQVGGQIHRP